MHSIISQPGRTGRTYISKLPSSHRHVLRREPLQHPLQRLRIPCVRRRHTVKEVHSVNQFPACCVGEVHQSAEDCGIHHHWNPPLVFRGVALGPHSCEVVERVVLAGATVPKERWGERPGEAPREWVVPERGPLGVPVGCTPRVHGEGHEAPVQLEGGLAGVHHYCRRSTRGHRRRCCGDEEQDKPLDEGRPRLHRSRPSTPARAGGGHGRSAIVSYRWNNQPGSIGRLPLVSL
jgi:hypothetical protein